MAQDIKRILYATDLSDNSAYAFGYALNLAKKYNAEITILHVLDIMMGMSANMVGVYFNEKQLEENLQKDFHMILTLCVLHLILVEAYQWVLRKSWVFLIWTHL